MRLRPTAPACSPGRLLRACCVVCAVCLASAACAPSLNWREVHLARLTTLLPCKPDTASRQVMLNGQAVTMEMAGCEGGGALFAISRVQSQDPAQASGLMAGLRKASLANIGQAVVHPLPDTGDAETSFDVLVDGKGADGGPLQARLKWLLVDQEVYQLAAYGKRLGSEQTQNLVGEARIR